MIRIRLLFIFLIPFQFVFGQVSDAAFKGYHIEIDIDNIVNDQVFVKVFPPAVTVDTLVYNIPKIVPGTYSISDFGRFIDSLKAIDSKGGELSVERLDDNRWSVANASQIKYLSYWVNDTFDDPKAGIFEPAGTNIEAGENVVLNAFGFVGYFDNMKNMPFKLSVKKPEKFYGETSLPRIKSSPSEDTFTAKDYFELHDCPILYCVPDTSSMMVGNTRIAVSVYSPGKKMSSVEVLETVEDLFPAAANYLGGTLPVDQYTILVYLLGGSSMSGGMGALEHKTSTLLVLPDVPIGILAQTIKDITAHEFFHVVTPLSIQSEYIADYDFMNPQMSEHLWFFEGCTEYASLHVQVKEGLMPTKEFFNAVRNKIMAASGYDTSIPFTEVSKKALGEHEDQYTNVYQQGALIGMALDLKLLKLSEGEYGTQELMRDLAKAYGPDKPFVDTLLFSEIGRVSGYPEATDFLERYVAHANPLPLEELFGYAGIVFRDSLTETVVSGGNFSLGYNPKTERMIVVDVKEMDDFGKDLGLKYHDEIVTWNGSALHREQIPQVLTDSTSSPPPGAPIAGHVWPKNSKGKKKLHKLKAKALEKQQTRKDVLEPMDKPTPEQLKIRKAWINT